MTVSAPDTGEGGGVGASLARQFSAQAARVTLVGRYEGPLEEVAGEVRAEGSEAHVMTADHSSL